METIKKEYTKYYCTTKNNQETYFSIDYTNKINKFKERDYLQIESTLHITYFSTNENFYGFPVSNTWLIKAINTNKYITLHDSIYIEKEYRSLGIGSFVFNEIMKILNQYIPNYSLKASLAIDDHGKENCRRRDKMYKNFGFEVQSDYIYIDKICNLKLDRKYNDIHEIVLTEKYSRLLVENKLQREGLSKANRSIEYYKDYTRKYHKLKKQLHNSIKLTILIIIISIFIIIIDFVNY